MTNTTYEILVILERHFEESVTLLAKLTKCPGQRTDILIPLSNELRYVRAQIAYEVTERASEFEMERADHWGRIHKKFKDWLRDPDDIYLHVEEREEQRKKRGLAPRVMLLPWSHQKEEKLLGAKRAEASKKRKQKLQATLLRPSAIPRPTSGPREKRNAT